MKSYYQDEWVTQYCGDALKILPELPSDSVDLLATDPPYGIGFMGKDWDKALPDKRIWAECFRVLKAGSFAFVMSIPRADCLSRMIISLEDAGFWVNFTPIFWAYASGFPKAQNIGKAVDKKLGAEREVIAENPNARPSSQPNYSLDGKGKNFQINVKPITKSTTPQAKALDGSYGGFQPKPAVEVIIVAMKPLSEKTFVDQALKNGKGITWLDEGRIPYESEGDKESARFGTQMDIRNNNYKTPQGVYGKNVLSSQSGRFPANLLVSDDVLNDGRVTKSGQNCTRRKPGMFLEHYYGDEGVEQNTYPDSGSFSRYFDLDKWWAKTFPFLIVPKASKSEKNRGCEDLPLHKGGAVPDRDIAKLNRNKENPIYQNHHPTVKPLKLMSYLITLGSRVGDIVLDPFSGSGTTPVGCSLLNRYCTAIEIKENYCEITKHRCRQSVMELMI